MYVNSKHDVNFQDALRSLVAQAQRVLAGEGRNGGEAKALATLVIETLAAEVRELSQEERAQHEWF